MSEAERRQWPRIPASLLSNVTASIIAGPDVTLVNLSRGGALMEVAARYPMRSKVRLKLIRPGGGVTQVNGTVSWAKVASISNGKINYLLAVIFEGAIDDLSAATGIDDIENHASVSMVEHPFEGTEASAAALTLPTVVSIADPLLMTLPVAPAPAGEPAVVEEDLSDSLFNAGTPPGAGIADQAARAEASARTAELRAELQRASEDLAGLSAANDNLSAQLQAYDEDRVRLRGELEAARQNWDEEKAALATEAAETLARVHELQAALHGHQQSGGQALAEQQALAQTLTMRLETLEAERGSLREELASERQRWEEDRAVVGRDAAAAVARAQDLQETLERRNRESDGALAEARALQQALEARLAPLAAERDILAARLDTERSSWQEDRASLVAAMAESQARTGELERALHEHTGSREEAIARARTREQELLTRLQAFDAEKSELTARYAHAHHEWQDERQSLAAAINDARARAGELESALHAQHEAQERALAEARAAHQELQGRLEAHDTERNAWHGERTTLASDVASAQGRVAELEAALHTQRDAHERHTQALAEAHARAQELQGRLDGVDAERQQWHEARAGLEASVATAAGQVHELQASLQRQDESLRRALEESQTARQQLDERSARFERDLSDWQAGREAERAAWRDERAGLVQEMDAATVRAQVLEDELRSREDEHVRLVAETQAAVLSLTARLEVSDTERVQVQRELAEDRSRWDAERADLAAEATTRSEEFHAALEAREQIHAEAIAREQTRFEELIAELMQAANDQQAEYQQLMAERTAALEEQVSRVERVSAELIRVRTEAELQRTSFDARTRQLEARLQAAEAVSAAHEQRQREVCREAERLVALLAAPPAPAAVDQAPLFAAEDHSAQAVA